MHPRSYMFVAQWLHVNWIIILGSSVTKEEIKSLQEVTL
jgi:hypothetical protein